MRRNLVPVGKHITYVENSWGGKTRHVAWPTDDHETNQALSQELKSYIDEVIERFQTRQSCLFFSFGCKSKAAEIRAALNRVNQHAPHLINIDQIMTFKWQGEKSIKEALDIKRLPSHYEKADALVEVETEVLRLKGLL